MSRTASTKGSRKRRRHTLYTGINQTEESVHVQRAVVRWEKPRCKWSRTKWPVSEA